MRNLLRLSFFMLAASAVVGQESESDWKPNVMYPNAGLPASLRPTEASFREGTFGEFNVGGRLYFSARLRNGRYEKNYKPRGSIEVELTGLYHVNEVRRVFVIAEYHKTSVGGSSSNDCFVNVVTFDTRVGPVLTQQIKFGCDSSGSGSRVTANGKELTVRQGYKGDRQLAVSYFKWDGSKFFLTTHGTEPLSENR